MSRLEDLLADAIRPLIVPSGVHDIVQNLGQVTEGNISAEDFAEDIAANLRSKNLHLSAASWKSDGPHVFVLDPETGDEWPIDPNALQHGCRRQLQVLRRKVLLDRRAVEENQLDGLDVLNGVIENLDHLLGRTP